MLRRENGVLMDQDDRMAWWQDDGSLYIAGNGWLNPEEAQQLAAFIKAGPPKRKWKITRTFDDPPTAVHIHEGKFPTVLHDDEIQEVWE